jgi:hypothetical protein
MCGVGVAADRRPIDPPPIIQLKVRHRPAAPAVAGPAAEPAPPAAPAADDPGSYVDNYLQNPYYFMFASLAKPDGDEEIHWLKVRTLWPDACMRND